MAVTKTFNAPPVIANFMRCDDFFRIINGPIGSGKSSACVVEVVRRCKEQEPGPDGIRHSRWVIVRNTRPQLKDTTLKTWFEWVPPGVAGRWKESEMVFYLEFGDVKAEILFRALDTPDDVKRVLSLEVTGAWLNESREIPKEIVEALQGRIGRYPAKTSGGASWCGMIADTNPPEYDSFWYKLIEHEPLDDDDPDTVFPCTSFKQPSGLSPDAENRENLPDNYYERLARGRSKDWVDTYIHGMYSPSLKGVPVYAKTFKLDRHVSKKHLPIDANMPVVIGMDFGRTPAAVFKQMTFDGRIYTLYELVDFDTGLERFIRTKMRPLIRNIFPTNPLVFIGDPAGVRRNDTDEGNCFKMLRDHFAKDGGRVKAASTNDPTVRIGATERALIDFPMGEPLALYDPRCKWLIEALRSRYRFEHNKNPDAGHKPKPEKNKWSHVAEADQYANLFLLSGKYDAADYLRIETEQPFGPVATYRPASYIGY